MATIASLVVMAVGAAVSAYAAYSAAQAQQNQLKQQAYAQEAEAEQARQAGLEAARRQRRKDEAARESFAARAAGAGVVAREGSSLMSELDFASQSELQALDVQHGYEVQASRAKTQASYARWQAGRISPEMAAGTSLLQSAGGIAGSFATAGAGGGKGIATAGMQTGGGLNVTPMRGTAGEDF